MFSRHYLKKDYLARTLLSIIIRELQLKLRSDRLQGAAASCLLCGGWHGRIPRNMSRTSNHRWSALSGDWMVVLLPLSVLGFFYVPPVVVLQRQCQPHWPFMSEYVGWTRCIPYQGSKCSLQSYKNSYNQRWEGGDFRIVTQLSRHGFTMFNWSRSSCNYSKTSLSLILCDICLDHSSFVQL